MDKSDMNLKTSVTNKNFSKKIYFFIKRLFDFLFGLIGVVLVIILSIIIKIIYVLNGDYSSIYYKQSRIGKNGKVFNMYKFRTMVPNADKILTDLLKQPEYKKEWDDNQKLNHDPRITRVGRILRKCSIDESPQFFSILIGNMSLIGPRPLVPGEIEHHHGNSYLYQSVKPGLSGWWAVNGRSATTYKDRLNLEYYYAKNCSLMLDLQIIIRTFKTVWTHEGAK